MLGESMSKSRESKSDWLLYFIESFFESEVSKQEMKWTVNDQRSGEAKTAIGSKSNQIYIHIFAVRKHEKINRLL